MPQLPRERATPHLRALLLVVCVSGIGFLLALTSSATHHHQSAASLADSSSSMEKKCPQAKDSDAASQLVPEGRQPSIFARIIRRQAPATILYEDDKVIAFLGLHQVAPVQFLVAPKRQLATLEEANACDEAMLGRMFTVASLVARQRGITNGYRLVINNGDDALQAVPHLHMHIFGGQAMEWPPGTGPIYHGS